MTLEESLAGYGRAIPLYRSSLVSHEGNLYIPQMVRGQDSHPCEYRDVTLQHVGTDDEKSACVASTACSSLLVTGSATATDVSCRFDLLFECGHRQRAIRIAGPCCNVYIVCDR